MWHSISVLLLVVPGQDPNDGQKLFQQMESALAKTKTLSLSFECTMEAGKANKFSGNLSAAAGNKARLELNGEIQGNAVKMVMVSDGTRMKITHSGGPGGQDQSQDTPKKLDGMVRAMVSRAGVLLPIFMVEPVRDGEKPKDFNVEEQLKVSDFKLGGKEKVGDREAQLLEYKLTTKSAKEPFSVSVWLDPKTNLPLKRTIVGKAGNEKMSFTETYTKLALDEKVDEKGFELPK